MKNSDIEYIPAMCSLSATQSRFVIHNSSFIMPTGEESPEAMLSAGIGSLKG